MESSTIPLESSPLSSDGLEVERAWYLLTVLLRIGRPCRPEEISAGCSLLSVPPETVIRSCFVRDSPLSVTGNFFVVPSTIATCALGNFMAKVHSSCVWPRTGVMSPLNGLKRPWEENVKTYSRKRKCISLRVPTRLLFHSGKAKLDDFSEEQSPTDVRGPLLLASCFRNGQTPSPPKIIGSDDAMQKEVLTMARNEFNVTFQSHISEKAELMLPLFCESHVVSPSVRSDCHVECTTSKADMKETVNARQQAARLATHDCGKLGNTMRDIESSHTVSDVRLQEYKEVEAVCQAKTMQVREMERDGACLPTCPISDYVDCSHASKNLGELVDMSENRARNTTYHGISHGEAKNEHADTILCSMERENRCNHAQTVAEIPESLDGHPEGNSRPKCNDSEMIGEIPDSFDGQEGSVRQNEACISRKLDGRHKQIEGRFAPGNGAQQSQLPKNEFTHPELAEHESKPSEPPETKVPLIQMVANGSMDVTECTNKKPLCAEVQLRHEFIGENNVATTSKLGQINLDEKYCFPKKQKRSRKDSIPIKNNGPDPTQKNRPQLKELPTFESFIVEEEEGSGGYGTVYRARRKHDGKIFAVKCPHPNAHMHHINNELKMLERFGGRSFVIKYEGSFKSGNSECLVLEYVEHDRPEVLKKEIDMFELRWYGYCMFRALAGLHKQGIVHRDVKPGNFLFSRRLNKGYLIDFNLAQDLHQKFNTGRNTKFSSDGKLRSIQHLPPNVKELPTTTFSAVAGGRSLEKGTGLGASTKESSLLRETNKVKRINSSQIKLFLDVCNNNKYKSQGADLSGVTPTKEGTSTRTSAERTRLPLPSQGRKELINMVEEAMQGPHHQLTTVPSSQRKRIAAPIGKMDRDLVFLSPMPVHSNGFAVSGSAPLKSKGDGKHKREGPCVGTKGFRAPEVLFKSLYQGYKVDVWSAGVSLLYLMIGRAPFVGDPEQNIKDIAKLRGSEELWELAKLHNRDLSFPMDLLDISAVPSMKLRDWCEQNSRKPDFLKRMPDSLFDLLDKCLTVNPRLRIDAEAALEHEFFSPCREAIRNNRIRRRGLTSDATASTINSISC
ncbi:uncharacterized protein LOC116265467 isoform X2 [Nymphaea colorata]|uniref:uncharacterized protein LOC116265467 isoform X2 n=1 Tax=Nymphaea colorata TaxID=210225 RepID=UPI00129DE29E|nr:uncharacterized protein LOC116265467 isoform X2 [Nymphaea colorata]